MQCNTMQTQCYMSIHAYMSVYVYVYLWIWLQPHRKRCFQKIYVHVSTLCRNEVHLFIVFIAISRMVVCISFVYRLVQTLTLTLTATSSKHKIMSRQRVREPCNTMHATFKQISTLIHSEMEIIIAFSIYFLNSFS